MQTLCFLAKQGYGTLAELRDLDTPDLLDIIEFEQITGSLERHYNAQAGKGRK